MKNEVRMSDYLYALPQERIALFPLKDRDASRLLFYQKGEIAHYQFRDITKLVPSNSTLYFNNSKVIQARLHFEKDTGATVEVFLLHPVHPGTLLLDAMQSQRTCAWQCTIGNVKRWKDHDVLRKSVENVNLSATLVDRERGIVEFSWEGDAFFAEVIDKLGETPLPPYLKREAELSDKERYQTVYSTIEGAVAAPTAGLHFTPQLLESLRKIGIREEFLTLHVSAGTFLPVKTTTASEHMMHQEQVVVTRKNIESLLNDTFTIAVGTTAMRTMESLYWYGVKLLQDPKAPFHVSQHDAYTLGQEVTRTQALEQVLNVLEKNNADHITGETAIFIYPGYRFRMCQGLITNFHQPGSTLILLVAAFVGGDWRRIYDEALTNGYRFLSYGDSSFLLPENRI
jgi:S-adenosylmethionine:tRNA ribosyltransferase-isomerase